MEGRAQRHDDGVDYGNQNLRRKKAKRRTSRKKYYLRFKRYRLQPPSTHLSVPVFDTHFSLIDLEGTRRCTHK